MNLDYQIALTNVPFDNSYKNVLRFDTRSEQEAYFKTNTLFSNSPDVNFNVGSLYATNVVYDGNENENINELLNKNYCIVKDKRENATIKYFYYFVTNAKQDCDNRILLALELDIFQTYYIDISFSDSVIYKAHLNRFVDNGNGTVSFDGTPTSKLFEREDLKNVSKRLIKRTKLNLYEQYPTDLANALNEIVAGWVYIYLDPTHNYNLKKFRYPSTEEVQSKFYSCSFQIFNNQIDYNLINTTIPSPLGVLAVPIYNSSNRQIKLKIGSFSDNFDFNYQDTLQALFKNNSYDYVYSIKFSTIPPFDFDTVPSYSIEDGNIILNVPTIYSGEAVASSPMLPNMYFYSSVVGCAFMNITYQKANVQMTYSATKQLTFTKQEIINSDVDPKFNPKLLSNDYYSLALSNELAERFEYDYQKLNKKDNIILHSESLTPDIAKQYMRIKLDNGVYLKSLEETLFGLVSSNDNSIAYISNAYQSMLANQKNYFLQIEKNRDIDLAQGLFNNSAKGMSSAMQGKGWSGVGQMAMGGLNLGIDYQRSVMNENFTLDNIKNAPANIAGAKGNTIFEATYTKPAPYIEEWDILPFEQKLVNDYMCMYGFTYNKIDNIKNVDNIRKIYNFVRADIETINSSNVSISETVRKKFRECFANGVRFWNTDTFAYNKENYERWLENG